jgi:7,8-dihydroneopterin aldolase/epimerase/oxygenase
MISTLEIQQLRLKLHFGVGEKERASLQEIDLNITINFNSLPKSCKSDDINDALCYDKLSKEIQKFCSNNKFYLIEHLSFKLHNYIKKSFLKPEDKLFLQVCKRPPVEEIKGQCCFTTGE